MRMKLLNKDKRSMEIELPDEDTTLLSPLLEVLLNDPKVEYATFYREHPMLDTFKLYVRVREGKPQTALKRAAKALEKTYGAALENVEAILNE